MANGSPMECGLCGIGRGEFMTLVAEVNGQKVFKFLCEDCLKKKKG